MRVANTGRPQGGCVPINKGTGFAVDRRMTAYKYARRRGSDSFTANEFSQYVFTIDPEMIISDEKFTVDLKNMYCDYFRLTLGRKGHKTVESVPLMEKDITSDYLHNLYSGREQANRLPSGFPKLLTWLVEVDGYDVKEIAKHMGVTIQFIYITIKNYKNDCIDAAEKCG